jgi:multimeric flavodoxin WrbA
MSKAIGRRELLGAVSVAAAAGVIGQAQAQTKPIRIIGISTSWRAGKNTAAAVQAVLDAAKAAVPAIEIELIDLADKSIPGYIAAGLPLKDGDKDDFPAIAEKLASTEVAAIIIGTPTYFGNMSALCKAFIERCIIFRKQDFALKNKVAGVVATGGSRDGNQELAISSIQVALMSQDMIIVGDGQPTAHSGATFLVGDGGIAADESGMATARNLGKRVAELAVRLASK